MNDDELRRQLQRRSEASPGETFRRQLLPAVSAAIREGSAEPVVRRGVGPLVALASVAAIVVLLIGLAIVRLPLPPSPAASASPTAGQPAPPAAREVDCLRVSLTGEPVDEAPPFAPTVLDATGLIERCQAASLDQMGPAAGRVWATRDAPRVLHVEWQGTPCDAAATLHFAGSYDAADLLVDYPGGDCDSMGVAHGVTLHTTRAVDPDDVTVRIETPTGQQGIDWAEVEAADAAFELRIFSPASTFVAGEPIEGISGELVYIGDQPEITLTGVGSLIQAFGVRQLDGHLSPGAGWNEPCVPESVRATIPYVKPFSKSGGFGADDPNADWYRQFFADPELRLPAGRWQITAYSHFYVGGCGSGAPLLELEASVVIDVLEAATSEPSPSSSAEPTPSPTMDPAAIELRTAPPNTSGYCRTAAGGGYLAPHSETGLGVRDANGTNVRPIIWPFGFTARREADGAVLLWPDGRILAREGNQISFGGGVGNDGIFAACGSFDVRPSQPSPTPSPLVPAPTELPLTELECQYDDGRGQPEISVVDRSGLLSGCVAEVETWPEGGQAEVGNPQGNRSSLFVRWDPNCGQGRPARISVWPSRGIDRPMIVILELLPRRESFCFTNVAAQGVVLGLSAKVDADDVELVVMDAANPRAQAETPTGLIEMWLEGPEEPVLAGQPIEIGANISHGQPSMSLSGGATEPGFSLTQLDGPLAMEEGMALVCEDFELVGGDIVNEYPAEPIIGYDGGGPYGDWYRAWSASDYLWLPAGTWLVQAHFTFHVGPGCGGEEIRLSSALVVTVTSP